MVQNEQFHILAGNAFWTSNNLFRKDKLSGPRVSTWRFYCTPIVLLYNGPVYIVYYNYIITLSTQAGSWANVVEECRKAHYQPLLLVYSNPRGKPVDASSVIMTLHYLYCTTIITTIL